MDETAQPATPEHPASEARRQFLGKAAGIAVAAPAAALLLAASSKKASASQCPSGGCP